MFFILTKQFGNEKSYDFLINFFKFKTSIKDFNLNTIKTDFNNNDEVIFKINNGYNLILMTEEEIEEILEKFNSFIKFYDGKFKIFKINNSFNVNENLDFIYKKYLENDKGMDFIYGAGGNHGHGLLGRHSQSGHITFFQEIWFIETPNIKIKQFYSSPVTIIDQPYTDVSRQTLSVVSPYYSGIVYTDASNKDHLYTWGANYHANLGNGSITEYSENSSGTIKENKLTDGSTKLPSNYTIDYIEANSFNDYAVITDQDTNQQHIYFWGASREEGLSTYASNIDSDHHYGDYYLAPIEINYPDNLDLSTNRITNISGGFDNTFLLTEDDNQIQHLYIWGDNSNNVVSGDSDAVIFKPNLIFNSINIIDSKIESIDKNNFNYIFTVENGNDLTSIIMYDSNNNTTTFDNKDWKVTEEGENSTTYSLTVHDVDPKETYSFEQIFYNSYFDTSLSNFDNPSLGSSFNYLLLIIILGSSLLLLILLIILLIWLKKRNNTKSTKMEKSLNN